MERNESAVVPEPERMLQRGASRWWWALILVGVAWLLIGWVVLRANATSLATVGVLIGIVLIASGVNEVALAAMVSGGWRFLHYAIAFLFLLAGLWAFIRPINTFFALASVLGLILLFYGAFEIVRAVASRGETPYWWVGLVGGILLLLLALWVSTSDPATSHRSAELPDPVLGRFHGVAARLHADHGGVQPAASGHRSIPLAAGASAAGEVPSTVPAQERRAMSQTDSRAARGPTGVGTPPVAPGRGRERRRRSGADAPLGAGQSRSGPAVAGADRAHAPLAGRRRGHPGVARGRRRPRGAEPAGDPGDRGVLRPGHGAGRRPPAHPARPVPRGSDRRGVPWRSSRPLRSSSSC
jgi:uncharacterized membrane protein HdeD (DUF308 family)